MAGHLHCGQPCKAQTSPQGCYIWYRKSEHYCKQMQRYLPFRCLNCCLLRLQLQSSAAEKRLLLQNKLNHLANEPGDRHVLHHVWLINSCSSRTIVCITKLDLKIFFVRLSQFIQVDAIFQPYPGDSIRTLLHIFKSLSSFPEQLDSTNAIL